MSRVGPRSIYPWRRSLEESLPRSHRSDRGVTAAEMLAIVVVIAAVVGLAVWFLFFASGGIGQGTV